MSECLLCGQWVDECPCPPLAENSPFPYDRLFLAARKIAEQQAEIERLKRQAIYLYNSGYNAGHHDTVEAQFTQVLPCDMRSYQADVVLDVLEGAGDE